MKIAANDAKKVARKGDARLREANLPRCSCSFQIADGANEIGELNDGKNPIWLKRIPGLFAALLMILLVGGVANAQGDSSAWEAPEAAKKVENPTKVTPAGLKQAAQVYGQYCVLCHGKAGAGDGAAGSSLTPKPANFTDAKLMSKATDGELFWKITTGRGPMLAWKDQLSESQRWQLVNLYTHVYE
jgi:mono/diheme cytochrome c family protein